MRTIGLTLTKAVMVIILGLNITACDPENNPIMGGNGNSNGQNLEILLDSIPMQNVDDQEVTDMVFMIEEEKMARDVYGKLFEMYSQKVFSNIYNSENTHMNSIAALLDRYSIVNPTIGKSAGEFVNSDIIELYGILLGQSASLTDALKVGALIEETDIQDLDNSLAKTDNADIQLVYNNLRKGSENHLRAFVKNLSNNGIQYIPQVLTQEEYDRIIAN